MLKVEVREVKTDLHVSFIFTKMFSYDGFSYSHI